MFAAPPPAPRATLRARTLITLLFGVLALAPHAVAQTASVVRGHVRDTSGVPLRDATVRVTARSGPATSVRTDSAGAYSVDVTAASSPYSVAVALIGYAPQTKQAVDPAPGTARSDVDFRLVILPQRISNVTSTVQRSRPQRSDAAGAGPGEAGTVSALTGGLSGDLTGDIASAMATIAGLLVIPDPNGGLPSISAFGLSADQNSLTLNGMNFGAGGVPRDGLALRVSSSTYDPGRGGFSGVQSSLRLPSGTNFTNRMLHVTHEDPHLQGSTPTSATLGNQYLRQILSGAISGPIVEDKIYYSTSFQFGRRSSDLATLTSVNPAGLQALRVSADSVTRLLSLLEPFGIPTTTSAVPSDRLTTNGSLLSRFDWKPLASARTGTVYNLVAGGNWSDNAAASSSPTALGSHAGDSKNWAVQLQGNSSRFFRSYILNETSLAFVTSSSRSTPYLFLPDARILIGSTFPDGTSGTSTVRVGGNSGSERYSRSQSVQLRNETSWFSATNRHQYKITFDGHIDSDSATQSSNRLGSFSYNSLTDFATSRPASFSRTLSSRETRGAQSAIAIGLGDIYRPISYLRIQVGARLEATHFGYRPATNPEVQSLFGLNTSRVPNPVSVAPMIGFTRNYSKAHGGSFTGGFREYVGALSLQNVEGVSRQTGLPDGVKQLLCVGAAVPTPDWDAYALSAAAVPGQCADGTSGTVFSQTTPPVSSYSTGYDPSRRWGLSAAWNGRIGANWNGSVTGNYSLTTRRTGSYDLNFNPVARFALASEAGRPVYVAPTSIVDTTGAITTKDSRRYQQFAQVNELRSDLRSDARQLIVAVAPVSSGRPTGLGFTTSYRASYTLSLNRDQSRGFGGGTTDGDPRLATWAGSGLPLHSFQVMGSLQIPGWADVSAFARVSSGRKYTPMISGDINGDGQSNDRAFVFDPATIADAAVSSKMAAVLNTAPVAARECLNAQFRAVASRNSCAGPWTQSMNLAVSLNPARFGLGDRGSISFVVTNLFAATDQLLHGTSHLHNWGVTATPDQTLLYVRGFDRVANRFKYDVNPSFGSTSASRATGRLPFMVSLDVQLRVGPDRDEQAMRTFLKPAVADSIPVLTEKQILDRLTKDAQNNFADLASRKALQLSPVQVAGLNGLAERFDTTRDSTYAVLAHYLASLKGKYQTNDAKARWHDAFVAIAHLYVRAGPQVRTILTDEQFASLPPDVGAYFDMDEATFQRLMKSANFGSLLELITGEGVD
jgi:hypothetical protein